MHSPGNVRRTLQFWPSFDRGGIDCNMPCREVSSKTWPELEFEFSPIPTAISCNFLAIYRAHLVLLYVLNSIFFCLLHPCRPSTSVLVINNNWFLLSFHFKVLIAKSLAKNEGCSSITRGCLLTHTHVYALHPFAHLIVLIEIVRIRLMVTLSPTKERLSVWRTKFPCTFQSQLECDLSPVEYVQRHHAPPKRITPKKSSIDFVGSDMNMGDMPPIEKPWLNILFVCWKLLKKIIFIL